MSTLQFAVLSWATTIPLFWRTVVPVEEDSVVPLRRLFHRTSLRSWDVDGRVLQWARFCSSLWPEIAMMCLFGIPALDHRKVWLSSWRYGWCRASTRIPRILLRWCFSSCSGASLRWLDALHTRCCRRDSSFFLDIGKTTRTSGLIWTCTISRPCSCRSRRLVLTFGATFRCWKHRQFHQDGFLVASSCAIVA